MNLSTIYGGHHAPLTTVPADTFSTVSRSVADRSIGCDTPTPPLDSVYRSPPVLAPWRRRPRHPSLATTSPPRDDRDTSLDSASHPNLRRPTRDVDARTYPTVDTSVRTPSATSGEDEEARAGADSRRGVSKNVEHAFIRGVSTRDEPIQFPVRAARGRASVLSIASTSRRTSHAPQHRATRRRRRRRRCAHLVASRASSSDARAPSPRPHARHQDEEEIIAHRLVPHRRRARRPGVRHRRLCRRLRLARDGRRVDRSSTDAWSTRDSLRDVDARAFGKDPDACARAASIGTWRRGAEACEGGPRALASDGCDAETRFWPAFGKRKSRSDAKTWVMSSKVSEMCGFGRLRAIERGSKVRGLIGGRRAASPGLGARRVRGVHRGDER